MWTGYFRIKKGSALTADDKNALLAMGQNQTPNYPNLRTHCIYSKDGTEAIIEGQFDNTPIESDVSFSVTEFDVLAGSCWKDRCCCTNEYLITNKDKWEEE